jgi:hypothetical protein
MHLYTLISNQGPQHCHVCSVKLQKLPNSSGELPDYRS